MIQKILLKFYLIIFIVPLINISFAQETYNFEVVFKRTNWRPDTIRSYGSALSTAGDLDQDGYDDIVFSVFFDNWYGYGYVFFGGEPMDTIHDLILKCEGEGQPLMSICSGDLNGDSISDVIIGEGQAGNWGKVFVFFGGIAMDSLPDVILNGESWNAWPYGCSVACGDINGDSFDDLIVGSYDNGDLNGRVYVYYGGPLLDTIPDVIINGHNGEAFGKSVGSGGDVNSDGFEDIVVGADENSEAYPGAGKVYVFFGGNPMDTIPDCWLHGEGAVQLLGWNGVDVLFNVSEYDRVLTGTPYWPNGYMASNDGKIYVLYGGDHMDTLVDQWMIGETDSSTLGAWSSGAGDCDGNSFEDIISGAPGSTALHPGGVVYLWLSSLITDTIPDAWFTCSTETYTLIGCRVASAGDVNDDGYDEVMFSNCAGVNPTVWVCRYTGTGVAEEKNLNILRSMQVYPNPFSEKTTINLSIEHRPKNIKIEIFDVSGRLVKSFNHSSNPQFNHVVWRGEDNDNQKLPCGVYFVQLEARNHRKTQKVILLR